MSIYNKLKKQLEVEKNSIAFKNIIGAFLVKGSGLIISLLTLPAYMRYFDNQVVLGVWFTLLSMLTWILSLDLGIGNGLRNKLVVSLHFKDVDETRKLITSSYFITGIVAVGFLIIGGLFVNTSNWNKILNISELTIPNSDLKIVVSIILISILIQFFLRTISAVIYALQKSAINNFVYLITSIMILLFVMFSPSSDLVSNLKLLAVYHLISVNIPLIFVTIVILTRSEIKFKPSRKYINKKTYKEVLGLGVSFFIAQILYLAISASNEFIISQFYGPNYVVYYQIYYRLFSLFGTIVVLALTPFWSIVTKAHEEKDWVWLKKTLSIMQKVFLIIVIFEMVLVAVLPFVIKVWLGDNAIEVDYFISISFALFGSSLIYQAIVSTFAFGLSKLKTLIVWNSLGIILKVIVIYIGLYYEVGWGLIILSTICALLPYNIIQTIELNSLFKKGS